MPASQTNTRDARERVGTETVCRSMLTDMAGRHDLGTLLQGDPSKEPRARRTMGAVAVNKYVLIQGITFADVVAFRVRMG